MAVIKGFSVAHVVVTVGLVLLIQVLPGCSDPVTPIPPPDTTVCVLTGNIVDPSVVLPGSIKVWVDTLAATFVGSDGHYTLTFTTRADSLTLVGRSGYGPYI